MNMENITTEFKREYTDDIKKTIIAFANTQGGELLIGIVDDGTVVGVSDTDETQLRVINAVRDSVKPDVTGFMSYEVREVEGKRIIAVSVQKGTASPYYLASKGIRPEGVYVRQGASTVPATESAILKMIKETGGDEYETTRSLTQELTFASAEKVFTESGIKFEKEQKRTLGLIGEDGAYTNLGLLLADQCPHTSKLAVFEGATKTVFKDRDEFTGSILRQLEDIYAYIDRFNRTRAEFPGLRRVDTRDYPPEAVREALLNAVVHRDYSYSGPALISIFDDRIEFLTLGGLPKGIAKSDVMMGVSVPRNNRLANIFYRLHLIEAFGTGMLKIKECYRNRREQPSIDLSDNAFKITLPNQNFKAENGPTENAMPINERWVLDYISAHDLSARAEIEAAVGMSQTQTIRILKKLLDSGYIRKQGSGKNVRYAAVK